MREQVGISVTQVWYSPTFICWAGLLSGWYGGVLGLFEGHGVGEGRATGPEVEIGGSESSPDSCSIS